MSRLNRYEYILWRQARQIVMTPEIAAELIARPTS
jgi:hypothetical protein